MQIGVSSKQVLMCCKFTSDAKQRTKKKPSTRSELCTWLAEPALHYMPQKVFAARVLSGAASAVRAVNALAQAVAGFRCVAAAVRAITWRAQ